MRLIPKILFESLILVGVLNILKGFVVDPDSFIGQYTYGKLWIEPNVYFLHINPRIDRFIYWLINDLSVCFTVIFISSEIIRKSYTSKWKRAIAYAFHSYYSIEVLNIVIIQLLMSGKSYNDTFMIGFVIILFAFRIKSELVKLFDWVIEPFEH
jgi:hypothetical protein